MSRGLWGCIVPSSLVQGNARRQHRLIGQRKPMSDHLLGRSELPQITGWTATSFRGTVENFLDLKEEGVVLVGHRIRNEAGKHSRKALHTNWEGIGAEQFV